jgi:hypothetical protein
VTETRIPVSEEVAEKEAADRLFATAFRDDSPIPAKGPTPPVAQPGIPPMSAKAVDDAVRMLSFGAASLPVGGMTALVVHVLGTVDPAQLAIAGATPVALVLAVRALLGRAKGVLPQDIHNHYEGAYVHQDQRNVQTKNNALIAKTINKQ